MENLGLVLEESPMKTIKAPLIPGKLYTCISDIFFLYSQPFVKNIYGNKGFLATRVILNDSLLLIKSEPVQDLFKYFFLYQNKILYVTLEEETFSRSLKVLNE